MSVYKVASLQEAVALATRLQAKGTYNWFRGQRKHWPPVSTLFRLKKREYKEGLDRTKRFVLWLLNTPGLEELKQNSDYAFAIAQHYGLPTPFMDFTTSPAVAGYFASSEKPASGEVSCIYCLNSAEFIKTWTWIRDTLPHYPEVKLIKVDVPNLWRLEAQQGVFVESLANWTAAYGLDRIEFPASLPLPTPTLEEIYPTKKSQLEILLAHHFESEFLADHGDTLRAYFPEADILELRGPEDGYFEEYFLPGGPPELDEWNNRENWIVVPTEKYAETVMGEISLCIHMRMQADRLFDAVEAQVKDALTSDASLRKKSVKWSLSRKGKIPRKLSAGLQAIWNGLRRLPYTDAQIAHAVAFCFDLYRLGYTRANDTSRREFIAGICLGPVLQVEFSSKEGNPVRAFASCEDLLATVHPHFTKFLRKEYRRHTAHVSPLLQACFNHRRMFVFEKFKDLFVSQIVPLQVLGERSDAYIYSPARLKGFGLP